MSAAHPKLLTKCATMTWWRYWLEFAVQIRAVEVPTVIAENWRESFDGVFGEDRVGQQRGIKERLNVARLTNAVGHI